MSKVPLCLVVLSLVFTSSVRAQVIRSHEGLDRNAVDSLFIQAELSLDGGAGNADYLDLRLNRRLVIPRACTGPLAPFLSLLSDQALRGKERRA